jgi:hypothetical protein
MAVCCQNLMLGALSSCSALSVLVGALFKNFRLFLNTVVHTKAKQRGKNPKYTAVLLKKGHMANIIMNSKI